MKNLNTKNKIIFAASFISMNILCTWLVLELGALLQETNMTIRLFEVGGSIRDELMGIDNPPDRDFCAESPDGWEALLAWCHANMKRVFLVTPE